MSERNVREHKAYCNANAKSKRESLKFHIFIQPTVKTMKCLCGNNALNAVATKHHVSQYDPSPLPTVFTDSTSSLFTGQVFFTGLPVLISPSYNYFRPKSQWPLPHKRMCVRTHLNTHTRAHKLAM